VSRTTNVSMCWLPSPRTGFERHIRPFQPGWRTGGC
jgi:hypothetical protein